MTKRNVEEYFYKPPTRRAKGPGEERKSCADFNQILDVKTTEEHGCAQINNTEGASLNICKNVTCTELLRSDNDNSVSLVDDFQSPERSTSSDYVTAHSNHSEFSAPSDMENKLNIALTNARSLAPKVGSLVDLFNEMDIGAGIITESWLQDGPELEKDIADLELGTGLAMIYKNRMKRKSIARYGSEKKRGGGVAIVYNTGKITLKEYKIAGNRFEMVSATGRQHNSGRVIFIFGIYVPPRMKVADYTELMETLVLAISDIKTKHLDPILIVGGDMNRRNFDAITGAFTDFEMVNTGPTRYGATLDLLITNIEAFSKGNQVLAPLETEDGTKKSDHCIISASYCLSKKKKTEWKTYKSREKTDAGKKKFTELLTSQDWQAVLDCVTSSLKAEKLDEILAGLMDECFPLKSHRVRADNPPWMTHGILKRIDQRKEVYKTDEKRSQRWKHMKELTEKLIKEKKREFIDQIKQKASAQGNTSLFYKAVHMLKDHERPQEWDIRALFEGQDDQQIAESVAEFFNKISAEFSPLDDCQISPECDWTVSQQEVSDLLKECKKPKSRVGGDIFPDLISPNADVLAIPLTNIYNSVLQTLQWPLHWKEETLIPIPKCKNPESLSQCRNLSCTMFFTKVLERFLFARITAEVDLASSQFGGRKKCGVDHMLIEMWNTILNDLDRGNAASCLISLDF